MEQIEVSSVETPSVPRLGDGLNKISEPKSSEENVLASIQSFPLAQRLSAALLDEGKGQANAAKNVRSGITPEETWIGGSAETMNDFNEVLEERIREELHELDLLDPEASDELVTDIRMVRHPPIFFIPTFCASDRCLSSRYPNRLFGYL